MAGLLAVEIGQPDLDAAIVVGGAGGAAIDPDAVDGVAEEDPAAAGDGVLHGERQRELCSRP